MKKLLLLYFFFLIVATAIAQNYSIFPTNHAQYFNSFGPTTNQYHAFPYFFSNDFTLSFIRESRIDSTIGIANGTIFYPFRTWRDTFNSGSIDTGFLQGPSWMGSSITEMNSGSSLLVNETGDTIEIKCLSNPGDTWLFMTIDSNKKVFAFNDSVVLATFAGITDSVKYLHLEVRDSLSNAIPTEPLFNKQFAISKSNGMVLGISIRELPDFTGLIRRDSIPPILQKDIYDFNIGDEFEYTNPNVLSGAFTRYVYSRITDKWFNTGNDTVFYSRSGIVWNTYYTTSTNFNDTIQFPYLTVPFYSTVPEQNGILHSNSYGVYTLNVFYNRFEFTENNYMWFEPADSLALFNHFEASISTNKYAVGLGCTYSKTDEGSTNTHLFDFLNWYRKGTEENGTYVDLTTDVIINQIKDVSLFPNPVSDYYTVTLPKSGKCLLNLYNIFGKIVDSNYQYELTKTYSASQLSNGVYILEIQGQDYRVKTLFVRE